MFYRNMEFCLDVFIDIHGARSEIRYLSLGTKNYRYAPPSRLTRCFLLPLTPTFKVSLPPVPDDFIAVL